MTESPKLRRFAPLILLGGGVVMAFTLAPHLPKHREVELRLEDPSSIVEVELNMARAGDSEPVQGSAWNFPAGTAPASLRASMNLPSGAYEVDVTVQRTQGRNAIHRVISLDNGDQIAIPVR